MFRIRTFLVFIFLFSLLSGAAYSWLNPDSISPREDAVAYDAIGWNLAQGNGFTLENEPTALRGPIYPSFLATIYFFSGHSYQAVRTVQIFLNAISMLLVFAIAQELFNDQRTAALSALLYALYPAFTFYTGFILTETLYTLLLLISMLLIVWSIKRNSLAWAGVGGLFLGLATLCKPTTLLYPFLLIFILAIVKERRRLIPLGIVLTLVMGLIVIIWTARNYVVFGRIVPVSVFSGYNLVLGSLPPDSSFDLTAFKTDYFTNPVQKDQEAFAQGIANIVAYPLNYILQIPGKTVRFFLPEGMSVIGSSRTAQGLTLIFLQISILSSAIVGVVIHRSSLFTLLMGSLISYFLIMHLILFATPRFNLPIMPYILMFSAAGFIAIKSFLAGKRS